MGGQDGTAGDVDPPCDCKVGRSIAKYGMDGVDAELVRYWNCGDDGTSLRDLAVYFNTELLGRAMGDADMNLLDGEVENFHDLLRDDGVSSGMYVQAKKRLEREGLDPDALESDFVSHQTIYRHLSTCAEVERRTPDESDAADQKEKLRALQNRTVAVTRDVLERLENDGELGLAEFEVVTDVRVICTECRRSHDIEELLDRGGCECVAESA